MTMAPHDSKIDELIRRLDAAVTVVDDAALAAWLVKAEDPVDHHQIVQLGHKQRHMCPKNWRQTDRAMLCTFHGGEERGILALVAGG